MKLIKAILALGLVLTLSACSSAVSPEDFVKMDIESTYLGIHSQEFVDFLSDVNSVADLEEYQQSNIELEAKYFLDLLVFYDDLDAEIIERAESIFAKIYESTKFEILGSTKDGNNTLVEVEISPIDILEISMTEEYLNDLSSYIETQESSADYYELNNEIATKLLDQLEANIPAMGYASPVVVDVLVIEMDNVIQISSDSYTAIDTYIISYDF